MPAVVAARPPAVWSSNESDYSRHATRRPYRRDAMNRRRFLQTIAAASLATVATGAAAASTRKPSTRAKYEQLVALISAWRKKDVDAVLGHVTDDIVWFSHVGSPPIVGKEAMRQVL